MLNRKNVFLIFLNLLILPSLYGQEIKNKIGIGFHGGILTIPGARQIDDKLEWPALKSGFIVSYKLNNYLTIQLESGYARSMNQNEIIPLEEGGTSKKTEINFRKFPIIETSLIFNSSLVDRLIFFIGPGIGYQKIEQNSRHHPLESRFPDSDINFSGFVILFCIGSEYYVKRDRFCCFFQFKQKIGSTDYEFNRKRVLNFPEGIVKGDVSLNGFEIVMGFKIFI